MFMRVAKVDKDMPIRLIGVLYEEFRDHEK